MSAFPIGVMLDSFRKPWTEALDIACELGASGIQAHGGHGLLAVKTVTPAVKKEFMAQMRDHGLVVPPSAATWARALAIRSSTPS